VKVPVEEYDERLTTVIAERALREGGASPERRKELRDAVAAQVMLQGYIEAGRGSSWR
jgi:putative Holliday junction resolvase